jgi:acyl-CoA-binding protein
MRPDGLFNFEAKAKWDVWEKNKDISKELAKEKYIIKAKIYFK